MSFTSTLSVGTRTVLVLVVEFFFYNPTSMENILQSIVKIIIIGSLYTSTNVDGNRQFPLPPPLPYYQNDGYFLPGFVPPYHEPLPVFYQEQNAPPPISYQNVNSYTPPQLFHQNENYHPPQFPNPNVGYAMPQMLHYKPNPPMMYNPGQKNDFVPPLPGQTDQKKPEFYATNIVIKDNPQQTFYQDDFNKNYQEDDYTDNYSDDASATPEPPCLSNSPYRYFGSSKQLPNGPNFDRYTLCNPHFQPNFGNGVYTVKMPITLLPSRFPPRVEEFIERIQNYFSTYNRVETPKPENQTSAPETPATVQPNQPVQPVTEAVSTAEVHTPMVMTTDQKKKNTTTEIELSLIETNVEPTEAAVVPAETSETALGNKEVTQKTIIVEIEAGDEDTPDDQLGKKSQVVMETPKLETVVGSTESVAKQPEMQMVEQTSPKVETTTHVQTEGISVPSEKSGENLISNELHSGSNVMGTPATEHMLDVKVATNPVTEVSNNTEGTTTNETLLEVTDKNG